jgi:hypothetical protein
VPDPVSELRACVFAPRCAHAAPPCREAVPPLTPLGSGRASACLRTAEVLP